MGSPSPAAPPDHAAPPVQLLRNSLGRSPPCPNRPPGDWNLPREFPSQWGASPSPDQCPIWGPQSFTAAHLPALLLPSEEFFLGKNPPPANRTHDSTFLLAPVPLSLARGSPWPPQPHPLTWKSGSAASSSLSPLGFSSFILERGGWVLDVRDGRFAEGWAGENDGRFWESEQVAVFFSWWWKMSVGKEGFEKEGRKKRGIKGRKKGKRRKRGEREKKGKIRKEK